jgi:hypothetical protein
VRWVRAWAARLASGLGLRGKDDFDEELASHIELHVDDNVRAGMTPDEARRRALSRLGGETQTKERYRDQRTVPFVDALLQDTRPASLRDPGRLAIVFATDDGGRQGRFDVVNYPDYADWSHQNRTLDSISAFAAKSMTMTVGDRAVRAPCA